MEDVLARAKKAVEEAEVFIVTSEETPVQFETNRLKHIQSKQSMSVALRVIKNGKIGYATATNLEDAQGLVDMAAETAEFGQKAEFEFLSQTSYPVIRIFDSKVEAVTTEEMAKTGEALISTIREHTPDLVCEGGVTKGVITVSIINSRGGNAKYKQSYFRIGIEGTLIGDDSDMLFVGESQSSCHPILQSKPIAREVIRQLDLAKNRATAATKSMPVIFTSDGVASSMITPLMVAFNGKTVLEGASPIGNKLGQVVFDKNFSLADDPTISYRPASHPFDDEGVPSQRTPLIEKGVVANFLYDLQTAGRAKKKSTGNGSRNGGLPAPSPSAFVIEPGTTSFNDMLKDIKEGLVIEQLMGAEQGNVLGGDFSGNVLLGYKVENGKIVGRVKNTMVSGNIYQLLKDITAIGSESKWVGGFLNTPPLYFSSVSVASK